MRAALRRPSTIVASTSSIAFDYTPRGYIISGSGAAAALRGPPLPAPLAVAAQDHDRDVVPRRAGRAVERGPLDRADHLGRPPARRRARRRDELVDLERPARRARVEHAVGVEQQRVARLECDLAGANLDPRQQPERAA